MMTTIRKKWKYNAIKAQEILQKKEYGLVVKRRWYGTQPNPNKTENWGINQIG